MISENFFTPYRCIFFLCLEVYATYFNTKIDSFNLLNIELGALNIN